MVARKNGLGNKEVRVPVTELHLVQRPREPAQTPADVAHDDFTELPVPVVLRDTEPWQILDRIDGVPETRRTASAVC